MTRLRSYRIILLLVAFVYAQWAFASHEHAIGEGAGEVCEVCLQSSHGKALPAPDLALATLPHASSALCHSASSLIACAARQPSARAPPLLLPF